MAFTIDTETLILRTRMIPYIFPAFPSRPEFDLYASMLPAKEVGGDFYDFFMVDQDNLAIIIADVSGKGIPAALFMVITKTIIRNCNFDESPRKIFEEANKKLCESNGAKMFVTAILGKYNIPSGKFVYANAGHIPPMVRKGGNDYEFLMKNPCIVLGFIENAEFKEEEILLEPGDAVFLFTDGVTEALTANREFFSEMRLLEAMKKYKDYPPKDLLSAIKGEIDIFTGGAGQVDDITMLSLEISRPSAEAARP